MTPARIPARSPRRRGGRIERPDPGRADARHGAGRAAFTLAPKARAVLPKLCFSLLIFVAFVAFSPIFTGNYGTEEALAGGGDSARQIGFVALFVAVALSTVLTRGAGALLDVPIALVVLLLWCWASIAWAIEPAVSFRRVLFTTIVALSVTYSVRMLPPRTVVAIAFTWFASILAADLLVMPFVAHAVHQPGELDAALVGNWRGVHPHNNEAGAFRAIAALVFIHMAVKGGSFITAPVAAALSLVFLAMTASKTSGGLFVVAVVAGVLIEVTYRNPALRKVALVAGLCVLLAVLNLSGDIGERLAATFDDPSSLTGRVQIWPVLLRYASDHLLLGSGYGSFWAIGASGPVAESGTEWLTIISHAHNGYTDLLVQTGPIGVTLAVLGFVVHPARILLTRPLPLEAPRWLLGAVLTFCWLHNVLETSLLDRANILWVTLLITYNMLERRPPARAGAGTGT